jgi:CheY-like chemotaxis protein
MAAADVQVLQSPKTILVVEDNDNDAELVRLMFRRSRILNPLQFVSTVQDAICYLKGEVPFSDRTIFPFPILLMVDSHLPDASGFELLRWVQVNKVESPLVAVMLTGSDLNALKMSYEAGAKSFLVKPLKFADFENMARAVKGLKLTTTAEGHTVEPE